MITIIKKYRDKVEETLGFPFNKKETDKLRAQGFKVDKFDSPGGLFYIEENPALPGTTEALDRPLYDTVVITNATTSLDLFTVPNGQGGKTICETNMTAQGQLPSPERFTIHRIGLLVLTQIPADMNLVLNEVIFTLYVNQKIYTQAPMIYFPCGFGIFGNTVVNISSVMTNGVPADNAVRSLLYPIPLEPLDPFKGNIEMHGGGAIGVRTIGAIAVSASLEVKCFLQGPYGRAI